MFKCTRLGGWLAWFCVCGMSVLPVWGADPEQFTDEQIQFFEKQVRPILVEHCYECHSSQAKSLKGGLKLDSRDAAVKGGDSGAGLVPGDAEKSLLIDAVRWKTFEMPPRGKLSPAQVDTLVRWVSAGAPWPAQSANAPEAPATYNWNEVRSRHWAWQPINRAELPSVHDSSWPTNEIDLFIKAELERSHLQPAPQADAAVLVRRLYFDLLGLPPPPERVAEFVATAVADRPRAWLALVDDLLASPRYGERWARHWLDVARYSDGFGGFLDGAALPHAWRYRDWVVEALNRDLPIDQFLRLQIAGDLLEQPDAVATGFFALGPTYISDGGDPDATAQAMSETLDDRVDTLSRGLLGLTVSCARCHDHKFDPIPQLDYYSLAGVFRNSALREFPLVPAATVTAFQQHQQVIRDLEQQNQKVQEAAQKEKRELTEAERTQVAAVTSQIAELKKSAPPMYPVAHALGDSGAGDMHLAIRGNLRNNGPIAPRRFLRILAGEQDLPLTRGSGRLDLAEAVVSPANPLTARVFVNRIWMHHFGQGLVRTPSNFGTLGEPPTHPQLLDWLAADFVHQGWSLKALHRKILTSSAWQMSSAVNSAALAVDADNRKLWRMNPRRLDVESWRDALLSVSGELDTTPGGPPVEQLASSRRRTLYGAVSRNGDRFASESFLRLFDFPLPRATNEGRKSSVVPQQALFLLNSPFMIARARALAARIQREAPDDAARIENAYQWLYGRAPVPAERQLGLEFLATGGAQGEGPKLSPWEQYAQVLLGANEFMYLP
ncbi:MAG: PSD1 domain-containing protein [Planctomycetes bacterium]|nr:PSD1 domain-containing protein [Planctomycetota bacterium]